ncbi:hypothetical protein OH76DRAFT_1490898 [Lentinus brumalis]|uniref:Uncharacterized protein n=1 Tax=Lentinus brumalis TaxID=2498619 RepID=A0A371CHD4_9APHY|nr:hypothetical protein OH76DRAFT_1490898 [Polyporus brumalis]
MSGAIARRSYVPSFNFHPCAAPYASRFNALRKTKSIPPATCTSRYIAHPLHSTTRPSYGQTRMLLSDHHKRRAPASMYPEPSRFLTSSAQNHALRPPTQSHTYAAWRIPCALAMRTRRYIFRAIWWRIAHSAPPHAGQTKAHILPQTSPRQAEHIARRFTDVWRSARAAILPRTCTRPRLPTHHSLIPPPRRPVSQRRSVADLLHPSDTAGASTVDLPGILVLPADPAHANLYIPPEPHPIALKEHVRIECAVSRADPTQSRKPPPSRPRGGTLRSPPLSPPARVPGRLRITSHDVCVLCDTAYTAGSGVIKIDIVGRSCEHTAHSTCEPGTAGPPRRLRCGVRYWDSVSRVSALGTVRDGRWNRRRTRRAAGWGLGDVPPYLDDGAFSRRAVSWSQSSEVRGIWERDRSRSERVSRSSPGSTHGLQSEASGRIGCA